MRYIQILIPDGALEAVLGELDKESIDYAVTNETGRHGYSAIVSFPVPIGAVESILERLRAVGVEEKAFTIILKPETVISHRYKELKKRYPKDEIAREELQARAEEMAPSISTFFLMTAVSAIVATVGLLTNSGAVIIGAMVIAPLMGPAMATSVGTVVSDHKLFFRGLRLQASGIGVAIVSAALFALLVKQTALIPPGLDITIVPEIHERLTPDFLSAAVALGAGIAAVVSLSRGVSSVIVGAMIAVALVPPAATVGLGIAWGMPLVMLGASVLLLVNVISINLAALAIFWSFGYRPQSWLQAGSAQATTLRRVIILGITMLILSVALGLVTYVSYKSTAFEHRAENQAKAVLKEAKYRKLGLLSISIKMKVVDVLFFGKEPIVVVQVDAPRGKSIPDLAKDIDDRITRETGRDVSVQVRFINAEET